MPICSFCDIVNGDTPARVVYDTESTMAFFPLAPAVPGHVLVIPKKHVADIWGVDRATAAKVMDSVLTVAAGVRSALRPDGMNIINSNGRAASQTVEHLHVHVVPRWLNDDFGDIWPKSPSLADDVKDNIAAKISNAIRSGDYVQDSR